MSTWETLGDAERDGYITGDHVLAFATTFGPHWRDVTIEEATESTKDSIARDEERLRVVRALIAKREAGPAERDVVAADVVRELYGAEPTPEQLAVVLDVISARESEDFSSAFD